MGNIKDWICGVNEAVPVYICCQGNFVEAYKCLKRMCHRWCKASGPSDLPDIVELQLAIHINQLVGMFYGLTSNNLRSLAYMIVEVQP